MGATTTTPDRSHVLNVAERRIYEPSFESPSGSRLRIAESRARAIKRGFDIFFGGALGLFAIPLGIFIALAIALESKGGVLYRQERVGRGGVPITVWKFRTMVVNAEDVLDDYLISHPELAREWRTKRKLRNDPRVTAVGRLLRRTSLDELPQFWNVLRGDMSMVGPRPVVSDELIRYGSAAALYTRVKPGLTGLWQVSGRNNTSYRRRIEIDSQYIQCWTVAQDFLILLKTVRVVVTGLGAS